MPKEYRTIREVAGPLMMVSDVEGVTYDELGEIELPNGETRRCKVLEVDGSNALVQLFESAAGINLANSKVRFLGRSMELPVSPDMLSRVFDGLGNPIDGGPIIIQKAVEIQNGDTPEILQKRVMEQAEWKILPRAVSLFCEDKIIVKDNKTEILD